MSAVATWSFWVRSDVQEREGCMPQGQGWSLSTIETELMCFCCLMCKVRICINFACFQRRGRIVWSWAGEGLGWKLWGWFGVTDRKGWSTAFIYHLSTDYYQLYNCRNIKGKGVKRKSRWTILIRFWFLILKWENINYYWYCENSLALA